MGESLEELVKHLPAELRIKILTERDRCVRQAYLFGYEDAENRYQ